jgi:O-antigen chain-terminating methyltransferase
VDAFYRQFEERYRGSRKLISSRLEVYLPFIEPLKSLDVVPIALDLGCGRGEWLELLQHHGLQAQGVDLDEGMLLACRELNLDIHQADALDYLRGLAADGLSVVSAFHLVEHIPFEALRQLVNEANRVLKPGGLLILETPNSENLMVGTSSFYLDPTHQKPLPAQLLSFVVEYAGFERVKTLYLQDSPDLATAQQTTLVNVLGGVSPDYAIVAQKKTTQAVYALFNAPFDRPYGLRLDTLAERYDQQTRSHTLWLQSEWDAAKQRIEELSKCSGQLEAHGQWLQNEWDAAKQDNAQLQAHSQRLQSEWDAAKQDNAQLQAHSQRLQSEWDTANAKIDELKHLSHHWWVRAESLDQGHKTLYASRSWRITKPLRLLSLLAKKIIYWLLLIPKGIWLAVKFPFKLILSGLIRFILKHPTLNAKAKTTLKKYPRLQAHLRRFASVRGMVQEAAISMSDIKLNSNTDSNAAQPLINADELYLTPRAHRIYQDLKLALEQQQKENS